MTARRRWLEWLTVSLICLVLGTAYTFTANMRRLFRGEAVDWSSLASSELLHFGVWMCLYPAVALLAARYPLGERRSRPLLVHLLAALVFSPVLMTLSQLLRSLVVAAKPPGLAALFTEVIVPEYAWGMTAYVVLLGVASAIEWRRRDQHRAVLGAQLEAALALARLQALRLQIQPHFLFNALNSISALLRKDPDAAERMVARLGDFLRLVLDDAMRQQVSLGQELDFLDSYLAIERVRFRDRLGVTIEVPPELLEARVPSLLLQPLFENSIRHGLGETAGPLRVALRAARQDGRLRLVVEDDGSRRASSFSSGGVGLANIRGRLDQLYGTRATLEIGPAPERGVRVAVELPYQETCEAEATS